MGVVYEIFWGPTPDGGTVDIGKTVSGFQKSVPRDNGDRVPVDYLRGLVRASQIVCGDLYDTILMKRALLPVGGDAVVVDVVLPALKRTMELYESYADIIDSGASNEDIYIKVTAPFIDGVCYGPPSCEIEGPISPTIMQSYILLNTYIFGLEDDYEAFRTEVVRAAKDVSDKAAQAAAAIVGTIPWWVWAGAVGVAGLYVYNRTSK